MRRFFQLAIFLAIAVPAHGEMQQSLAQAFEQAWARQPVAQALLERERAAQARRSAADAWTPVPVSVGLGARSDRFNNNVGATEYDVGLALPLWLPGERSGSQALADAESLALSSRAQALRLQVANECRLAWWAWQLARNEKSIVDQRVVSAARLRDDVARRVKAGDLARADLHQADGALAAAMAQQAEAGALLDAARFRLQALTGQLSGEPSSQPEKPVPDPLPETLLESHPRLQALLGQGEVSRRNLDLARTRNRANPELTVATRRERNVAGEALDQTWALGVRIPFSAGARQEARLAEANADLIEATLGADRERERLIQEIALGRSQLVAARAQREASAERARLASENREFVEKSFRFGQTDLPTRLRIEQEAFEAERQLNRARINEAQSLSTYRQALGLLPE